MKNVHYFLSILLLLFSPYVFAKRISPEQSLAVAEKLVDSHSELRSGKELKLVYSAYNNDLSLRDDASSVLFYVYNIGDQGFVIVAGDDVTYPLIGYSFNGIFEEDKLEGNFKFFLEMSKEYISWKINNRITPPQRTVDAWDEYLSGKIFDSSPEEETFGPFVTARWGQANPYNFQCPKINGKNTLAGCITTAMVQLMYYWAYPTHGTGSIKGSYTNSSKLWVPTIDFSAQTYEWDKMLDAYNSSSSQESINEAAKLTYQAAVSLYADFGLTSTWSAASDLPRALMSYFGYDSGIRQYDKSFYTLSDWENLVTRELRERRPVFFRGEDSALETHVYICDGKDNRGAYHFNWGWEGLWNGYYTMETFDDVDGKGLPSEYKFSNKMTMMAGVQPDKGSSEVSTLSLKEKTNLYSDSEKVKKNEKFTARAQFKNNGFKNYRDEYYIVLTDSDSKVIAQLSSVSSKVVLTSGSSTLEFQFTCIVPPDITDGDYTIRAAVKDVGTSVFYLMEALPGYIDSLPLKVEGSLPLSVKIEGGDRELRIGEMKRFRIAVFPSDANKENVIWTSSDSTVVEIDEKGYATAKSVGKAVITVRMKEFELSDSCKVSVNYNLPVYSDTDMLVFDNSYLRGDANGSLEMFLKIPETEYFYGSFIITLPEDFTLNSELTSLIGRSEEDESEVQITRISENSWEVSISQTENIEDQIRNSGYLKIMDLVYNYIIDSAEYESNEDSIESEVPYEASISDLNFNFAEDSLYKSEISFPLLLEKIPLRISSLSVAGKIYLKDGILFVDSPYSEQIRIYSITGNLLKTVEKQAGEISIMINKYSYNILLIRGSSGWVKKLVI